MKGPHHRRIEFVTPSCDSRYAPAPATLVSRIHVLRAKGLLRSMPPSEKPPLDNIVNLSESSSKRRLHDHHQQSATQKEPQRHPAASPEKDTNPAYSSVSKRLKTSHSSGNLQKPAVMSKVMGRPQPQRIDLTVGNSNFQPHTGAKRLVIKNLRTVPQRDTEVYYTNIWNEVDAAITSVLNRQQPSLALDSLSRKVQDICRRDRGSQLSSHLRDRCKTYLEKELLPIIESHAGPSNVDALRAVYKYWEVWNEQSVRSCGVLTMILTNACLKDPSPFNILLPRQIISPTHKR